MECKWKHHKPTLNRNYTEWTPNILRKYGLPSIFKSLNYGTHTGPKLMLQEILTLTNRLTESKSALYMLNILSKALLSPWVNHSLLPTTVCVWFVVVSGVCFCEKAPSKLCQMGFRRDDLVDSPLAVITSNTESHKKCCWSHGRKHPDSYLQGFIKCCKDSQSNTSCNCMRHKQYKCMWD